MSASRVDRIFDEPSVNGEIATAPGAPLPGVPAPPAGFEPPPPPADGEQGAVQARDGARA